MLAQLRSPRKVDMGVVLGSEANLISAAMTLGAGRVDRWSPVEQRLVARVKELDPSPKFRAVVDEDKHGCASELHRLDPR